MRTNENLLLNNINSKYNKDLNILIVTLPDYIKIHDLNIWKSEFIATLSHSEDQTALLIDTNLHDFESIECLKLLRQLFDEPIVKEKIKKTAFVSPEKYKKAELTSVIEAYFESLDKAYNWLKK